MRFLLLGVVLSCCCGCDELEVPVEESPAYDPTPDQWPYQVNRIVKAKRIRAAVHVRLAEGGRLMLKRRRGWDTATLNEFATELSSTRKRHHRERQAKGKSGYGVDENGDAHISRVFVDIELRPDTPWQHLWWLMSVCTEEFIDKLQLRMGNRVIHLFLPWDGAVEWRIGPPLAGTPVLVFADPPGMDGARYRARGKELVDLAAVRRHLKRQRDATKEGLSFVAVLLMERRLRCARLFDLFEMLVDAGIARVRFDDWRESTEGIEFDYIRYPLRTKKIRDQARLPSPY